MTRYVAFLRGVNVGGRIVRMNDVKTLFAGLGLQDVSTVIASGNVLFASRDRASALETRIEAALAGHLGYEVTTMVRSRDEVAAIAGHTAFPGAGGDKVPIHVGVAKTQPAPASVRRVLALQTEIDSLHVHGREVYWLARNGISRASITMAAVEKALGTPVTFRALGTMRRLAAKLGLSS